MSTREGKTTALVRRRDGTEREFLPAALEVQETPPSPAGRVITGLIVGVFVVAVVWSYVGHVDVVATATGKIVPSGHVKVIQPMEQATVRAIRVAEGQRVEAGDVLVEFDPTIGRADRNRLREQLMAARLDRARLLAEIDAVDGSDRNAAGMADWPKGADPAAVATQKRLLSGELADHRASVAALQAELVRARAERNSTAQDKRRLESTLPLIAKRAAALHSLASRDMASEFEYLDVERTRLDHTGQIRTTDARLVELDARIDAVRRRIDAQRAKFRKDVATDLVDAQKRIATTREELRKAMARAEWSTLRAPISGFVQGLKIHTTGGVVEPAQELMRVVPEGAELQVQAWLANRDVGFVDEGQTAEVKVETFPFTRYGTLHATVTHVSNDATAQENGGLIYETTAALERSWIEVDGRQIPLSPGMTVSLEIKTGQRRVLDFVLAPLVEHVDESARER
ncbi:Hemolysin secretion protein D, plasmid [wastewater metagenome]|uniref:Hemolysin secretion protein D, plasmid n=2 Tax=unclassified sequences TaxID=12908 RepID=A0A5B8RBA7_9ZZZZ|nr:MULTISPECIES: HlyD family type I secretion periplasmic adaptor subunit [Arhodomonas]QEA05911.1 hemolysin secretion protein D, plasmid [uncultured organism]